MWDYWKAGAISYFQSNEDPAECPLVQDPACPSLILHSIYTVLKLRHVVHNALWPALRESNPYTAVTTLDNHLERLKWEDCYAQHCRSVLLGDITPYEIWGDCGPVFCPPNFPPELVNAVKKNVAIALTRANMGVIKNLCGINWIIEPLGSELRYANHNPTNINAQPCDTYCAEPRSYSLCYTRDWLEGVGSGDVCDTLKSNPHVQAFWDHGCDKPAGLPDRIWPGLLAAECIVRSMLPSNCPNTIHRCC